MRQKQEEIIKALGAKSEIEPFDEINKRVNALKAYLIRYNLNGFVLGVSGGQDSTLVGKLAQMAIDSLNLLPIGKQFKLVAVRLPYGTQLDEADAQLALDFIQPTESYVHDIKPQVDAAIEQHKLNGREISDFVKGNNKARARMITQYDIAASEGLVVLGTDHAAEAITGFFTKFGDGAADFLPLAGLSKRQGRTLLKKLGAPEQLYNKVPTADLLDEKPGQTDEDELGISYKHIDDYLEGKEIPEEVAEKLESQYDKSQHKRNLPVTVEAFLDYITNAQV